MKYAIHIVLFCILLAEKSYAIDDLLVPDGSPVSLSLVFNQPRYVAGDTAFFKGYVDNAPKKLLSGNTVVGLSLQTGTGVIQLYNRFYFVNGTCAGQFIIPSGFAPGKYWLVADLEGIEDEIILKAEFIISGEFEYEASKSIREEAWPLHLETSKEKFAPREQVTLKIVPEQSLKNAVSVTVIKEDLFTDMPGEPSLFNMTYLLSGQADGDLKTSGPDYFKGKLQYINSKKPVPDSTEVIFYLNLNDFIYRVFTRNGGTLNFQLFKTFSDEQIYFEAFNKSGKIDSVELVLDGPGKVSDPLPGRKTNHPDAYSAYANKIRSINDSYYYYQGNRGKVQKSSIEWWPDVDYEIDIRKFETFYTMEEVFTNVIPTVKFRKGGDDEGARVFLQEIATYTNRCPLYIIDGIMTDNTSYVNQLDPAHIIRIGVCRSERILTRFGKLGSNGILAIETDFDRKQEVVPVSKNSFSVTGFTKSLSFSSRIPAKDHVPVFRSTLFWNPAILIEGGKSISFTTCDDLGYYRIVVSGKTETNEWFTVTRRIEVAPR